jgi:hypothetical protein
MVFLFNQKPDMNKKLAEAKTPQAKEMHRRRIDPSDSQIDRLVYRLYDLTEKEIKIGEGKA